MVSQMQLKKLYGFKLCSQNCNTMEKNMFLLTFIGTIKVA